MSVCMLCRCGCKGIALVLLLVKTFHNQTIQLNDIFGYTGKLLVTDKQFFKKMFFYKECKHMSSSFCMYE